MGKEIMTWEQKCAISALRAACASTFDREGLEPDDEMMTNRILNRADMFRSWLLEWDEWGGPEEEEDPPADAQVQTVSAPGHKHGCQGCDHRPESYPLCWDPDDVAESQAKIAEIQGRPPLPVLQALGRVHSDNLAKWKWGMGLGPKPEVEEKPQPVGHSVHCLCDECREAAGV